jgi:hypothetical protein
LQHTQNFLVCRASDVLPREERDNGDMEGRVPLGGRKGVEVGQDTQGVLTWHTDIKDGVRD